MDFYPELYGDHVEKHLFAARVSGVSVSGELWVRVYSFSLLRVTNPFQHEPLLREGAGNLVINKPPLR